MKFIPAGNARKRGNLRAWCRIRAEFYVVRVCRGNFESEEHGGCGMNRVGETGVSNISGSSPGGVDSWIFFSK